MEIMEITATITFSECDDGNTCYWLRSFLSLFQWTVPVILKESSLDHMEDNRKSIFHSSDGFEVKKCVSHREIVHIFLLWGGEW